MKTLDEVMSIFPNTYRALWKQHTNGNGWVYRTAYVSDSSYIEGLVYGYAQVYGNARVYGNAQVYGDAQVYGYAWVYGDARVYGYAWVYGDALVYGDAQVYGYAWVYGKAQVYGDAWAESPLYIQGTKHSLTLCSHTQIAIGCHVHSIAEWKKHYKAIGRKEGYTPAQIKEYGTYITLLSATAKRLTQEKEIANVD